MAEVDNCTHCGVGVPEGKQCSCSGAKAERKNTGTPDGTTLEALVSKDGDVVINIDDDEN